MSRRAANNSDMVSCWHRSHLCESETGTSASGSSPWRMGIADDGTSTSQRCRCTYMEFSRQEHRESREEHRRSEGEHRASRGTVLRHTLRHSTRKMLCRKQLCRDILVFSRSAAYLSNVSREQIVQKTRLDVDQRVGTNSRWVIFFSTTSTQSLSSRMCSSCLSLKGFGAFFSCW